MTRPGLVATPTSASTDPAGPRPSRPRRHLPGEWLLVGVVVLLFVAGTLTTDGFATLSNVRAILIAASITGIVAVGMTFVTLSGNFVSLGLQQTTVLASLVHLQLLGRGAGLLVSVVVPLAVLVVVGLAQAALVILGLNTVVTTLATGAVVYGVMASLTSGRTVTSGGHSEGWLGASNLLGAPVTIYAFVLVTVVAGLLSRFTVIGRQTTLTGSNAATAQVSGLSRPRVVMFVFVAMSIAAGVAGILSAAQLGQATSNDLPSLTIDVVAAVLVGGTLITGGSGSPVRSALGAFIIALLANVMVLHGYPIGVRLAVQGGLVILVVTALQLLTRRAARGGR